MSSADTTTFQRRLGRRQVVRTGGLVAGAAALLAAPGIARAQTEGEEIEFDVALDGATIRYVRALPGDPSGLPLTGDQFIMFGSIFPADEAALRARADEARDSRLWAGIHFPIDNEMGATMGAAVGRLVAEIARNDGVA